VAVVGVAQALLVALYLYVLGHREARPIPVERVERPAPELVLGSSDGSTTRLSDLRGTTVVLHFWATWCPPCREELPSLLEYASSGDASVRAVSVDPEWDTVRSFLEGESLEPVYLASGETVEDSFGVDELPETLVIDPSGTVRLVFHGRQDWSSRRLRAMIAEVGHD
jgi:cytochrome c biogenesis protein CcmG/thiol:disulfide interchange protein DsbE